MKKSFKAVAVMTCGLTAAMLSLGSCSSKEKSTKVTYKGEGWKEAQTTTYAAYPETVVYTIGVNVGTTNVPYPEGSTDTIENSAYTRFLKSKLNIQNKDAFEAISDSDNNTKISMAITSGDLPDIFRVNYDQLKELVENGMIEDLTTSYNNCASQLMKDIYASNGNRALDMATFDGKIYGIPTTSISSGPEMLWLRKDWMDKLGLKAPETLEDIEKIVAAFEEKDPGNNGKGKTVGIPLVVSGDNFLYGGYGSAYKANNIFSMNGAYPEQWMKDSKGNIVYGSTQKEMKEGLKLLAEWYKKGIIDRQFAVRTYDDIKALVTDGKCGSYFCGWWAPYDLAGSYELNNNADWAAYILPAGKDGKVTTWNGNPTQDMYDVVRKGYAYPELIIKAKSVTLDYNQGDAAFSDNSPECKEYMEWVQKGYGKEFIGGFDWFDAVERAYLHINEALEGKRDPNNMTAYENSLYNSCVRYQNSVKNGQKPEKSSWIDYNARIKAGELMHNTEVDTVYPVFFGQTSTMDVMWDSLKTLERTTMLKIIMGEQSLDSFDDFVKQWNQGGGSKITEEVAAAVN